MSTKSKNKNNCHKRKGNQYRGATQQGYFRGEQYQPNESDIDIVRRSGRRHCPTDYWPLESNAHAHYGGSPRGKQHSSLRHSDLSSPSDSGAFQPSSHQRKRKERWKNRPYPRHIDADAGSCSATPATSCISRETSLAASASSGGQGDQVSDIPGFYYDEEKKTYFKILPNSMSSVPSFVTKENIKKKEAEQQRLSDLKHSSKEAISSFTSSLGSQISRPRPGSHFVDVLKSVQCGQFTCENLRTYMIRHSCSNIQPDSETLQRCPALPDLRLEEIQKMDVNRSRNKLLCLSSLTNCLAHCVHLMSVKEEKCCSRSDLKRTALSIRPTRYAIGPIYKKITSMCWAPVPSLRGKPTVFLTATCPAGYFDTIAYVANLEATMETAFVFELNLGFKTVWSAAWSKQLSRFSVGSERKCHLVDVATRRKWIFNTYSSDPLSQLFSPTESNIMYNGTRDGLILMHDMRARGNHQAQAQMRQGKGVGCLRLQNDENYLLASDFSGTICQWDRRMSKQVMLFKGLVNSHYQLPFKLDETETIICSTGSDSYTKLWDTRSGELLKNLPPPYQASLENFPLSLYSTRWGNVDGNSAVIVAMRDKFKLYC